MTPAYKWGQGFHIQPHSSTNHLTRKLDVPDGSGKLMLWTIFVILLILWLVGWVGFHVVAWYVHLLLVIALVVLVIQLVSGRRAV
jgi:hypothetical protein